jgi:hypothetical protein
MRNLNAALLIFVAIFLAAENAAPHHQAAFQHDDYLYHPDTMEMEREILARLNNESKRMEEVPEESESALLAFLRHSLSTVREIRLPNGDIKKYKKLLVLCRLFIFYPKRDQFTCV